MLIYVLTHIMFQIRSVWYFPKKRKVNIGNQYFCQDYSASLISAIKPNANNNCF